MPPSPEELQRLNSEFNDIVERCGEEIRAAERRRRAALLVIPPARHALLACEDAVARAHSAASDRRRDADALRASRNAEAQQTRAAEEDAGYAAFLAVDAEDLRRGARQKADEDFSNRVNEVGRRNPPASEATLNDERRSAARARDEAYAQADEAYTAAINAAHEALASAQQAAYWKYVDAADRAAMEHQEALAAIDVTLQDALRAAEVEFASAIAGIPEAAEVERTFLRSRSEIEQRWEVRKEAIYRQLRGEPSSLA